MGAPRSVPVVLALLVCCVPCVFGNHLQEYGEGNGGINQDYQPCYSVVNTEVVEDTRGNTIDATFSQCGDRDFGEQHLWWRALEPSYQCFGANGKANGAECSVSASPFAAASGAFYCLKGDKWDERRQHHGYGQRPSTADVVSLEIGNWPTYSMGASVARLLLEEMMGYRVALVSRTGTFGAFERAARHKNYVVLEAWESEAYSLPAEYYVWGDPFYHKPFMTKAGSTDVMWSSSGATLPAADQPRTTELRSRFLAFEEEPLKRNLLGASGKIGIFVNGPMMGHADKALVDFWRGYQSLETLALLPPDNTVKCKDRLRFGTSCTDKEAKFYCPAECPSPLWDGSAACCINGKFYPPQCIPEGTTYDMIREDPEWTSPYCKEFLHPDAGWDVAYFEAVIVNLKLNLTVSYLGYDNMYETLLNRSRDNIPTIFYWWEPEGLLVKIDASQVILPRRSQECVSNRRANPLNSSVNCDVADIPLTKFLASSLKATEPNLYQFFLDWYMSRADMIELLLLYDQVQSSQEKGGASEQAACQWLKNNYNKWDSWVHNDYPQLTVPVEQVTPSQRFSLGAEILVIIIVLCFFLVASIVFWQLLRQGDTYQLLQLKWQNIQFDEVPTVLGEGNMGEVLKGYYHGMPVTVKPVPFFRHRTSWLTRLFTCKGDASHLNGGRQRRGFNAGLRTDDSSSLGAAAFGSYAGSYVGSYAGSYVLTYGGARASSSDVEQERQVPMVPLLEDSNSCQPEIDVAGSKLETHNEDSFEGQSSSWVQGSQHSLSAERSSLSTTQNISEQDSASPIYGSSISKWPSIDKSDMQQLIAVSLESRMPVVDYTYANITEAEKYQIMKREVMRVGQIRHPHLAAFVGLTVSPDNQKYMVMEFVEGSLHELVHNRTVMIDEFILFSIVRNITDAMTYLHSMDPPIAHGTLKTANVLVDTHFTAKVAEFGISETKNMQKSSFIDEVFNIAPEVHRAGNMSSQRTLEADVYSFGLLVWEMFSRTLPALERHPTEWVDNIFAGVNKPLELSPKMCSFAPIRDLVVQCQDPEPSHRPTFAHIKEQLSQVKVDSLRQFMGDLVSKRKLLDDILPPKVAKMLAEGKKVEPEHFDCVTIFFSDIVGYTKISSELPAEQVMEMLDRLYAKFDNLARQHRLFKVETIGDAYMAVGNLMEPQADHAVRISRFAMDAIAAANSTPISLSEPSRGNITIRVGFHAGPVVASVVGKSNPRYCLFGDTVNVASRMESTSEPNCIHLSGAATKAIVAVDTSIPLIYRGYHEIKGKGSMDTFWIMGYSPETSIQNKPSTHLSPVGPPRRLSQGPNGMGYVPSVTPASKAKVRSLTETSPEIEDAELRVERCGKSF